MGSKPRQCSSSLWPETEEGRKGQAETITNVLSSAVFGLLTHEEACKFARVIERESFATADDLFERERNDGRSALRLYESECCRRMCETLNSCRKSVLGDEAAEVDDTLFDISCDKVTTIGEIGAKSVFKRLAAPGQSYKKFCFRNISFGLDAANVAKPFLEKIKTQVTELDISGFVRGKREDEALAVMRIFSKALEGSVLRCLNISDIPLGLPGVKAFTELLSSQQDLEELYMKNNGLSAAATTALLKLIPSTGKLKVLHLHNNFIGDEGAKSIAEIIERSPNLVSIRCSAAGICSNGVIALAEALGVCTHLEKVDLRDNWYGADAETALVENLGKLPHFPELHLSSPSLKDKGKSAMINVIKKSANSEVCEMIGTEKSGIAAPPPAESEMRRKLRELSLAENNLFAKKWRTNLGSHRKLSVDGNKHEHGSLSGAVTSDPGLDKNELEGNTEDVGTLNLLDKNKPEGEAEDTDCLPDKGEPVGKAEGEDDADGGLGLKQQNMV